MHNNLIDVFVLMIYVDSVSATSYITCTYTYMYVQSLMRDALKSIFVKLLIFI